MPYCPRCKTEYREGEKTCAGCGAPLAEDLPGPAGGGFDPGEEGVFLAAAKESADVLAIEGRLRTAGIPFRKKGTGGPGAFAPYTFGAEFYVPAPELRRALSELPPGLPGCPKKPGAPEGADKALPAEPAPEGAESGGAPRAKGGPLRSALAMLLFFAAAGLLVLGVDFVMNLIRTALRIPG